MSLWKALDYESVSSYTLTFSVRDSHLLGQETKSLTVEVENVNEENWIQASVDTITFNESAVGFNTTTAPGAHELGILT